MLPYILSHWPMLMAIILSVMSVITGLKVLGSGIIWRFKSGIQPYTEGDLSAWLYLLVLASTSLSIFHSGLLLDWMLREGNEIIGNTLNNVWHIWHSLSALFMTGMHALVFKTMKQRLKTKGKKVKRLWGN